MTDSISYMIVRPPINRLKIAVPGIAGIIAVAIIAGFCQELILHHQEQDKLYQYNWVVRLSLYFFWDEKTGL